MNSGADRGMSTVVSHVMSVGITVLLIISLVATATGFLEEQQRQAADQEIETVGNRLAQKLESADRLAQRGDEVRVRASLPETVAGSTYTAELLHDSPPPTTGDCSAFRTTTTCLRIAATAYDHTTIVAVDNETELSLTSGVGGTFLIGSDGGSDTTQLSRQRLDMSPRVGIGQSIGSGPQFGGGTTLSQTPIPDFTLTPGIPTTGTPVQFDASGSSDPDGSITTYEWDFDEDGSFEATGVTKTHVFSNAGTHNVTLRVTDNSGLSASKTEQIQVSGLEYVTGSLMTIVGNDEAVTFSVRNRHSVPIEIERVMIDPAPGSVDELSESRSDHEIEIDSPSDSGHVDTSGSIQIEEDGTIVKIDDSRWWSHTDEVTVGANEDAVIRFQDFSESVTGTTFTFGVRYRINSTVSSTVFTDSTP